MPQSTSCFAGRIIIRADQLAGLVWDQPCPVPAEVELPTRPPMYFCVPHGEAIFESLYEAYDKMGLIDHDIVAKPSDEFDALMDQLGPLEGQ